ncbi:Kinesin-like protein KIF22-A [Smittium mucronatum]|uniref:Kinesin-like protein n=1 Tax=Smittium mucronatum TaxID=133383 RepID=A0A1R0H303_9FUNG|nr:Kinesin-like protein KIF22-A [Smittium mucronatum]
MTSHPNKVQVLCRIRPFLKDETVDNTISTEGDKTIKVQNHRDPTKELHYTFDACFDSKASQKNVYFPYVKNLVDSVFEGQSSTIFCYGVTGAGKTFTIQGDDLHLGIIPRAMMQIFANGNARNIIYPIKMSYYEVFKENVYDLLRERDSGPGLPIREDSNRRTFVAGLKEELLTSFEEFKKVFNTAAKRRRTASTRLNANSSRSHAVLMIKICSKGNSDNIIYEGQLNLIDLAGSEDNRKTDNNRERMKESTAINQSLFVLGKVIEALNSGAVSFSYFVKSRIPYRDSKMTRILQDSLGGGSKSMMIVNIAPGESFLQDTQKTLNYATKAREVVNKDRVFERVMHSADSNSRKRSADFASNNGYNSGINELSNSKRKKLNIDNFNDNDSFSRPRNPINNGSNSNGRSRVYGEKINSTDNLNIKKGNQFSKISNLKNHTSSVEEIVVQKIQTFEKRTENMSNEITKRLDRLEKKLNDDSHSNNSMIVDSDILDLISPTTKLKTSKALLVKGKELEKSGNLHEALKRFEQALHYAPELVSLSKHIDKLRNKIKVYNEQPVINNDLKKSEKNQESLPIHFLQDSLKGGDLFSPTIKKNTKKPSEITRVGQLHNQNEPEGQSNISSITSNNKWKVLASASKKNKSIFKNTIFSLSNSPFKSKSSSFPSEDLTNNSLLFNYEDGGLFSKNLIKRKTNKNENGIEENGISRKISESKILTQSYKFNLKKPQRHIVSSDSEYDSSSNNNHANLKKTKTLMVNNAANHDSKLANDPTLINSINKADLRELVRLKGVGKKRAMVIREFILNNGYIENVYDLINAGLSKTVVTNILSTE